MDLKHENEIKEFENYAVGNILECTAAQNGDLHLQNGSSNGEPYVNDETNMNDIDDKDEVGEIVPRLSKAQKRRNKRAILEKERNMAIAAQELENINGLRHLESGEIKKKLSERHLAIHEVPSDGNCLYKAVEHQLSLLNLKETTVGSLRELTSKYMFSHMEDYIPFLTCPETGDIFTKEQYIKYCEDIASTSVWGGHIEIQALSNVCGIPIEVIQAKGPSVFAGNENCSPKLILSYHRHAYGLGEHYNSVIPVTE